MLVVSIVHDNCRAVAYGKWKFPKHTVICLILLHLFRSGRFITMLKKICDSESYSSLELKTDVAQVIEEI